MRVVFVPRALGRAPDSEPLAAVGIALHEQLADLRTLTENAPLLAEADALVIEIEPGNSAHLEAFDRLVHLSAGEVPVVVAVDGLTVAHTRTLLRAGAVDVLPLPFTAEELKQAIEPARRPARPAHRPAPIARRQGKIIAFIGALGGVGATSIATQAGILWAAEGGKTAVVDLDVQFGNAALFLDVRPSMNIGNLMEDSERLDAELLQSIAVRHPSGLDVLASPSEMMPIDAVTADFVDQLFRTAVQVYDVLLVDLPTVWTDWTVRVLQRADVICLVTNMSVPGIYQARRQIEVIDANGLLPKLQVVANRVQSRLFGKVDTKETEAVLGRRIDHLVTNDYPTISAANDEGRPIREIRGNSKMVKDLKALRDALAASLAVEGPHA